MKSIAIYPWPDPVIDTLGHDPRSLYVETFWLPSLGPTALLLLRYISTLFNRRNENIQLEVPEVSQHLGLGYRDGKSSPVVRSFERLVQFDLACATFHRGGIETFAIRRHVPPINRKHVNRLPERLQEIHRVWTEARLAESPLQEARRRARKLATILLAQGDDIDDIEHALHTVGFHPSICRESAVWAHKQLETGPETG